MMQEPEKPYDFFHVYDYPSPDIFAEEMMQARGFDSREDAWVYWDLKHSSGEYKDYQKAKKQYETEKREQRGQQEGAYGGFQTGGAVYKPSPEEVREARSGCLRGVCFLLFAAFLIFMGFKAALAVEDLNTYYTNYYLFLKDNNFEAADKFREQLPGWWKDTETLDIWREAGAAQESGGSGAALKVLEKIPDDYRGEFAEEIQKYKQRLQSAE